MISLKHEFIFVHIPRTAGTSIEWTLQDETCTLLPNEWDESRVPDAPLNHLTLQQIRDHGFLPPERFERFFKFCFVRNPWDRLVSEMFYLREIGMLDGNDAQAFEEMRNLESVGNHLTLQHDFVTLDSEVGVDFIGRFENLQNDFDRICDIIGIARRQLPFTNTSTRQPHWNYYDSRTRSWVARRYRRDLEAFGYGYR